MSNGLLGLSVTEAGPRTEWYALYTRHQHEKTIAKILTYKGYETFLPLYDAASRWKDRTKVLSLPLFPCYVFLKGDLGRRLDVLTTPGIHALVSYGGQLAVIPDNEIEGLRRVAQSGMPLEPHPFLKCGESVRVKSGPLAGVQGVLVKKRNLYRLVLSVEMLGKSASVEIDAFLVEKVSANQAGPYGAGPKPALVHPQARTGLVG